jgi:site-specific DNA recombinase
MVDAKRTRCLGYARSGVAPATGSACDPIEAQAKQIRQKSRQFQLLDVLREPGRSGNDLNRPQLKKLLTMVRRGRVDAVVVARLASLSRSVKQFDEMMRDFERHAIRFISVGDGIDTATAEGKAKIDAVRTIARTLRAMDRHRSARGYGASMRARCA